jgi:4-hydroxybenzoate polyprenyltransferase
MTFWAFQIPMWKLNVLMLRLPLPLAVAAPLASFLNPLNMTLNPGILSLVIFYNFILQTLPHLCAELLMLHQGVDIKLPAASIGAVKKIP